MKKYILYFILICLAIGLIKEYIVPILLLLGLATIVFVVFYSRRKKLKSKEVPPQIENSTPNNLPKKIIPNPKVSSSFKGFHLAYSYDNVKFYPPEEIVSKISKSTLQAGAEISLKPEPSNRYDDRAIALYIDCQKIGYLLKGTLQDMTHDYLSKNWPIVVTLSSLEYINGEYQGYIDISFYRESGEVPASAKRRGYQHIDIHSIKPINPNALPDTPLTGKNIVFSGYFSLPIEEMMQAAVDAGAILKSRVTKNTEYLVVGEQNAEFLDENGMSSKQRTATKLIEQGEADIKIIDEKTFLDMAQYSATLPF